MPKLKLPVAISCVAPCFSKEERISLKLLQSNFGDTLLNNCDDDTADMDSLNIAFPRVAKNCHLLMSF